MEIIRTPLESDTPGQHFALRIIRFRGSGDGPRVYMQAALHANELPGMVALDGLIPLIGKAEREGRLHSDITLVPYANPFGLAQSLFGETLGRFDFHARTNFNRSYPQGGPNALDGRPAPDRLKAALLEMAVEADVVLDLHCDDEGLVYLYISDGKLEAGRRLACAVDAEVILVDRATEIISFDLAVTHRWASEDRTDDGRFAATIELRGMMDVSVDLARKDAAGLYRYLAEIGAVTDAPEATDPVEPLVGDVDDAVLIPTPVAGALLYGVNCGDWVVEGQTLVSVLCDAGDEPHEVRAPFAGLVMTRRDRRFARRGDDVIKVLRCTRPSTKGDPEA